MSMFENISPDSFSFLVFIVPGFFFLVGFNIFNFKRRSSLLEIACSLIIGILLMAIYHSFLPREMFERFTENLYSAAIIFSFLNFILGLIIRTIWEFIKNILNPGY